jgi:toxin CptA
MIAGAAFAAVLLCAAVLGLAIQRGATCTLATVHELLTQRRPIRLLAMPEASLWVAGSLWLARSAGTMVELPLA